MEDLHSLAASGAAGKRRKENEDAAAKAAVDSAAQKRPRRGEPPVALDDPTSVMPPGMDMHVDMQPSDAELAQLGVPGKLFAPALPGDVHADALLTADGDAFASGELPFPNVPVPTPTRPQSKRKRDEDSDGEDESSSGGEVVVLLEVAQRALKLGLEEGMALLQEQSFVTTGKIKRKKHAMQRTAQYSTLASRKCRGEAKHALQFCERIFKEDETLAGHLMQLTAKQRAAVARLVFATLVRASIVESKGDFPRDMFAEVDAGGWVDATTGAVKDVKLPSPGHTEWHWKTKELLEFARGCLDPRFHDQHSSHRKFKFFPHQTYKEAVPSIRAATRLAILKVVGAGAAQATTQAATGAAAATAAQATGAAVAPATGTQPAAGQPEGEGTARKPDAAQDDAHIALTLTSLANQGAQSNAAPAVNAAVGSTGSSA